MPEVAARHMAAVVEDLRRALQVLGGRASPSLLDPVRVEAYGNVVPLPEVGSVSAPEPRMLAIQVWDPTLVGAVTKALQRANLGGNPQTDGQTVRLAMPAMSEERRREIVRKAREYAETARIKVRQVRRDRLDHFARQVAAGKLGEGSANGRGRRVQEQTDLHVDQIDAALKQREAEIMTI